VVVVVIKTRIATAKKAEAAKAVAAHVKVREVLLVQKDAVEKVVVATRVKVVPVVAAKVKVEAVEIQAKIPNSFYLLQLKSQSIRLTF
jgi:hypothetical protein